MPQYLKPVPKTHRKALLERTVQLVKEGRVAFVGTENPYVWKASEGDFKWTLSRSKDGHFCLAVYGQSQPVFIRSSGGELHNLFYDLLYLSKLHEENVFAPKLLQLFAEHFGGAS